jgi:hypothetical protein
MIKMLLLCLHDTNAQGWPEPYIYIVYDRIFGDFPAKIPYIHRIYMVLANPTNAAAVDAAAVDAAAAAAAATVTGQNLNTKSQYG